jgi:hypothetical protein
MLNSVVQHAREDVEKVTDPKARPLFETTAEVLEGLMGAYEHAMAKTEALAPTIDTVGVTTDPDASE